MKFNLRKRFLMFILLSFSYLEVLILESQFRGYRDNSKYSLVPVIHQLSVVQIVMV